MTRQKWPKEHLEVIHEGGGKLRYPPHSRVLGKSKSTQGRKVFRGCCPKSQKERSEVAFEFLGPLLKSASFPQLFLYWVYHHHLEGHAENIQGCNCGDVTTANSGFPHLAFFCSFPTSPNMAGNPIPSLQKMQIF